MSIKEGSLGMLSRTQLEKAGFSDLGAPQYCGQSVVYRAYHNATSQHVALKLFPLSESIQDTLREATAIAGINHANIACFVAAGYIESLAYLATQWIDGVRLSDYIAHNGPLAADAAIGLTVDIADGLIAAHAQNWVHGDLSPANIIRDQQGHGVLIDFGLGAQSSDETIAGSDDIAGSPRYLAPEIIAGNKISPQSDQYALALICYEMLTGIWPFSEQSGVSAVKLATALHHQLYSLPVPLTEREPSLSTKVDGVLIRALAKDPGQRFPDIKTFCEQLQLAIQPTTSGSKVISSLTGDSQPQKSSHFSQLKNYVPGTLSLATTGVFVGVCIIAYFGFYSTAFKSSIAVAGTEIPKKVQSDIAVETTACNLMPNPWFNDALSDNFYKDKKNPHAVQIHTNPEIASSPLLHVGDTNEYGLYGQIVKIDPNEKYKLSAHVYVSGEVEHAELYVSWLDENWQLIEGSEAGEALSASSRIESSRGKQLLSDIEPPANARYAVPSVFKNASNGKLEIDNMSFSADNDQATGC